MAGRRLRRGRRSRRRGAAAHVVHHERRLLLGASDWLGKGCEVKREVVERVRRDEDVREEQQLRRQVVAGVRLPEVGGSAAVGEPAETNKKPQPRQKTRLEAFAAH